MTSNRDIIAGAFERWMDGDGGITELFAPQMRWEITGTAVIAGIYASTEDFLAQVLDPFLARFRDGRPFRPVRIREIYADDERNTVIVVWDGEGVDNTGNLYRNSYAWIMRMADGRVIDATAFFDSKSIDALWTSVAPAESGSDA